MIPALPRRLAVYLLLVVAVSVLAAPLRPGAIEERPTMVGDIIAHLAGARLLIDDPASLYQPADQFAVEQRFIGGCCPGYKEFFLSPPFVALAYVPFLGMGLPLAQAAWFALSIGLLAAGLIILKTLLPTPSWSTLAGLAVPFLAAWPTVEMLLIRQDSAIALLLLAAGLRLLIARRDAPAGAVLALGLYKPQLFLFVPLLLVVQRRWAAVVSWLLASAALVALSVDLVGLAGLRDLVVLLASPSTGHLMQGRSWQMISLAALARGILGGHATALVAGITFGAPVALAGALTWIARRPASSSRQFSLHFGFAVVAGLMATPYAYEYDAVVLVLPIALLLDDPAASAIVAVGYALASVSLLRDLVFGGGAAFPVPLLPPAILTFLILLARRCSTPAASRRSDADVAADASPAASFALVGRVDARENLPTA